MPKKYNDDLDAIVGGDKKPPEPPPPEEVLKIKDSRGYAKKEGMRYWGTPEQKTPPPPMTGEEAVKYRSGGKGAQGLPEQAKREINSFTRELRGVLSHTERQWLGNKYIEWGQVMQARYDNDRKRLGKGDQFWVAILVAREGEPLDRAVYIAKELRS